MGSEEVRRTAARIQQIGEDVRQLSDRTPALSVPVWRSSSAVGFRTRLQAEVVRIRSLVTELDTAAEVMLSHAVAVERTLVDVGGAR